VSQKETCVTLSETVALPAGKATTNLIQKVISLSQSIICSSKSNLDYIVKGFIAILSTHAPQLVNDDKKESKGKMKIF
jgi:hypothetical protein